MKKISFILLVLLTLTNAYSQVETPIEVELQKQVEPNNKQFLTYNTYDIMALTTDHESGSKIIPLSNKHYKANINLTQDTDNADFKIILTVTRIVGETKKDKDSIVNTSNLHLNVHVYDKYGNTIYNIQAIAEACKSVVHQSVEDYKLESLENLIQYALLNNNILKKFSLEYLVSTQYVPFSFVGLNTGFKSVDVVDEWNTQLNKLNNLTLTDLRTSLNNEIAFWETCINMSNTGLKKEGVFKDAAKANIAMAQHLLGNKEASEKYATEANASVNLSKWGKNAILNKGLTKDMFNYIEKSDYNYVTIMQYIPSEVSMAKLLADKAPFSIKGNIKLTNGTLHRDAVLKIAQDVTPTGGNIVSFDKNIIEKSITTIEGNVVNVKISDIESIQQTNDVYLTKGENLLKGKLITDKIEIYEEVYPGNRFIYYKKPNENFASIPLFGEGKWRLKYFDDCPDLVKKLESKEIKNTFDAAMYYGKECK